MKLISLVVPFYNEGDNVKLIYKDIKKLQDELSDRYQFEVIFMDNHSTDGSTDIVRDLVEADSSVRLIRLSRNFGYQASILTGYLNCNGDAVVQVDSDGEDDPNIIKEFLKKWEDGYEVVYGIRISRKEAWHITLQRKMFYRIINRLSYIHLPVDSGDFRLIDRKVLNHLSRFKENTLYLRGIISYIGFKQTGIPYKRRERYLGQTKFGWYGAVRFAWEAIASFSTKPLLYVANTGLIFSIISILVGFVYLVGWATSQLIIDSSSIMILCVLFFSGIQLFSIGIVGAYVGRILEEVKQRPISIIEEDIKKV